VHHILSLYGTGANAAQLQQGYDSNDTYRRSTVPGHASVVGELRASWDNAGKYLAKEQYFLDFLAFFQGEIDRRGWQVVTMLSDAILISSWTGTTSTQFQSSSHSTAKSGFPQRRRRGLSSGKSVWTPVQYAARRCPPITMDKITPYQPKKDDGSSPIGNASFPVWKPQSWSRQCTFDAI
jgi:hypothetical protein